jgi:ABC-type glutathione transport system ATPase component
VPQTFRGLLHHGDARRVANSVGYEPGNVGDPIGVVFTLHHVTKIYHMGEVDVQALHAISLDLYAGEFLVLLGPSGNGKSTLLNILGGLDVPSSGRVLNALASYGWAVGHRNRVAAEVLDGLQEGDPVILYPTDELREGAHVKSRSDGR